MRAPTPTTARPASQAGSYASSVDDGGAEFDAAVPPEEQLLAQAERSPFVDLTHPVTLFEGLKLVLMAPVVALKLLLLAACAPFAWALLWLMLVGHVPQSPMGRVRQLLVRNWVRLWARFVLLLCGFYRVKVCGWNNYRAAEECRAILVFNHPSYVDAAVVAALFQPSGVSKAGVASIPIVGLFAVALQLFFVERRGSSDLSNRHVLHGDAVAAIAQRSADRRFPLLALAPEATTKAKPCLLKFKRGAFATARPVCPVLLRYSYRRFNPAWGIGSTPFHVYRLMAQFANHLEVEVMPPYLPSEKEQLDWGLYASNVRALMAERLGVPLVEEGIVEERRLAHMGMGVNWRGTRLTFVKHKAA